MHAQYCSLSRAQGVSLRVLLWGTATGTYSDSGGVLFYEPLVGILYRSGI